METISQKYLLSEVLFYRHPSSETIDLSDTYLRCPFISQTMVLQLDVKIGSQVRLSLKSNQTQDGSQKYLLHQPHSCRFKESLTTQVRN